MYVSVGSPDDPFGRMMVQNLRKRGCVDFIFFIFIFFLYFFALAF